MPLDNSWLHSGVTLCLLWGMFKWFYVTCNLFFYTIVGLNYMGICLLLFFSKSFYLTIELNVPAFIYYFTELQTLFLCNNLTFNLCLWLWTMGLVIAISVTITHIDLINDKSRESQDYTPEDCKPVSVGVCVSEPSSTWQADVGSNPRLFRSLPSCLRQLQAFQ